MIQGFDPRTGEPVGEPVAEMTDAEVDAAVTAAVAAAPAWAAFPRRAEALEAVGDALDARAGELAAIADTETALGGERLLDLHDQLGPRKHLIGGGDDLGTGGLKGGIGDAGAGPGALLDEEQRELVLAAHDGVRQHVRPVGRGFVHTDAPGDQRLVCHLADARGEHW